MNTIEIRQRRKMVVPFIVACVLLMLITAYAVFFTDKYKDDTAKRVSFIGGVVLFSYFAYSPIKKLLENQPIIVLTSDSIVLNTTKTVVIPKKAIQQMDVVYIEETGYFLNIKTEKESYKTNISWLDKTPDQIKDLVEKYKQ